MEQTDEENVKGFLQLGYLRIVFYYRSFSPRKS